MIATSRPLRFVALVLGGWIAMRAVQLWPVPIPIPALMSDIVATIAPPLLAMPSGGPTAATAPSRVAPPGSLMPTRQPSHAERDPSRPFGPGASIAATLAEDNPPSRFVESPPPQFTFPIGSPLSSRTRREWRLRGSAWAIIRGGVATPFASQLGGSQAGVRVTLPIDDARRVMLAARLSTALGARQREAAIGVDWQPTAIPIHLIVEQRVGLEGASGGPSVGVIGGVGPVAMAAGWRLEAYGQAGAIARNGRVEGYADGALRVARPVLASGRRSIDLGLGAWGGAQRGAARLDVGPTASVSLPIGDSAVRFSVDCGIM